MHRLNLSLEELADLVGAIDMGRENLRWLERIYSEQKKILKLLLLRYYIETAPDDERAEHWATIKAQYDLEAMINGRAPELDKERVQRFLGAPPKTRGSEHKPKENPASEIAAVGIDV